MDYTPKAFNFWEISLLLINQAAGFKFSEPKFKNKVKSLYGQRRRLLKEIYGHDFSTKTP